MRRVVVAALLMCAATGCNVGPKYKHPVVQAPDTCYPAVQAQADSIADLAWWDLFKDQTLQSLIKEALRKNYDLQLAVSRVEQEQALLGSRTRNIFLKSAMTSASLDSNGWLSQTTLTIPSPSPRFGKSICLVVSAK